MKLQAATEAHLRELMTWFPDRASCRIWGGPDFRHPFTEETFRQDAHWDDIPSYALVDAEGELVAFGQFYLRAGRCNLSRLVVSPGRRRRGLGRVLIQRLAELGCRELSVNECSLFVMADNAPAVNLYRKLGFRSQPYPEADLDLEGALYMVSERVKG